MFSNLRPDCDNHLLVGRRLHLLEHRYLTRISCILSGGDESTVRMALAQWCAAPDIESYSVGYVSAVVRRLRVDLGRPALFLTGTICGSTQSLVLDGDQ